MGTSGHWTTKIPSLRLTGLGRLTSGLTSQKALIQKVSLPKSWAPGNFSEAGNSCHKIFGIWAGSFSHTCIYESMCVCVCVVCVSACV